MNAQALKLTQNRWGFIAFMSVMCTLSPFALSFPLPAFPTIATEFTKPVAEIQFLISAFLVGLGLAQPVHGVLADRYGRRPVLLCGFAIFAIASLASILTTSWTALVACRFFQAVGVSAGTVTSRAIVNDIQPREEAAISLSYISIAMGLGPILAPIFGGLLDEAFGWRSIFTGCLLAGLLIWALAIFKLPETCPKQTERRKPLKDYASLLKHPGFMGYTLMFGFGQGVFFAFLPFAPDYFENVLGHGTDIFVLCWIFMSVAFMTGSLFGARVTRRMGMDGAILAASIWLLFAVLILAGSYFFIGDNAATMTITIMLILLGTGLICPLALAGSVSLDPKLAATAAGLSSSLGLMTAGVFAVIGGILYNETLWPFIGLAWLAILGNLMAMRLTRNGGR